MKRKRRGRVDRLSSLPDEVICHILSFLRTKRSVQTSILSKRWRFLWAHVPVLDFHVDDRVNSKIVTKIVLHRKHDIHTFRLHTFGGSRKEFELWIANITTCNIRNLALSLQYRFALPQCIFSCRTLVDLSLSRVGKIPMSGLCFPALKKLKLHCVLCESHESLSHLISACPVLDELSIEENVSFGSELLGHCCISSPTLTRLVLQLGSGEYSDFGVKLDTPALKYLRLCCFMPDKISVGALDSLIEANIIFWWEKYRDNFIYWRNVLAFVSKLYNVKLLTLSDDQIAVIRDFSFSALANKFHHLTKLCLRLSSNLGLITSFLENANNLQFLWLKIQDMDGTDDQYGWMEPKQVPPCLTSHLQTVVCYFGCSMEEFDILRYILMNAKVLKRMEIHIRLPKCDSEKKLEALNRLALFERGSQECQLKFD